MNEESDLVLAEQAIASNLKSLEGVIRTEPENTRILFLLCQGYSGYALGFAEDTDAQRAREMYRRGKDYGLRVLKRNRSFAAAVDGRMENFERSLQTFDKDNLPTVFWTATGWGSFINLSKDDPDALAQLPRVVAMMRYVLSQDEDYYYGGAHLFIGSWFGSRSRIFGGDPDSAKYHFERCIEIGQGHFLLPYVYYARYHAVQVQDRTLFEELLTKVLDAPSDVLPEQRLVNSISKRKAKKFLEEIDSYF